MQTKETLNIKSKDLIETIYTNISGFSITPEEEDEIRRIGGAPTYGEITYEGAEILLNELKLTKKDIFYDLGSGVGKLIVQTYLTTPVKTAIGIELSKNRYNGALKAKEELKIKKRLNKRRNLLFKNEDILKTNFDDATIIFMCSTCFSDECLNTLMNKMAKLKKGLKVITLRTLPENDFFILTTKKKLPMTWSLDSSVYFYQLQ